MLILLLVLVFTGISSTGICPNFVPIESPVPVELLKRLFDPDLAKGPGWLYQ